jgi:serine/threonine-protein phosphatase 6 regulatory ankyrin repeat subunit B
MVACGEGHIAVVNALIAAKANVSHDNGDGGSCISYACRKPEFHPVVAALLDAGAQLNRSDRGGQDGLFSTIMLKCHESLKAILASGRADVRSPVRRYTPLDQAILSNNLEAVKLLVEAKADIAKDCSENCGLGLALNMGSPTLTEHLLAAGADVDHRFEGGYTPLHMACVVDPVPALHAKLPDGFKDNPQLAPFFSQPRDHLGCAKLLLAQKADADARSRQQHTPLMGAASAGNLAIVRELIAAGASVNAVDADGKSVLSYAIAPDREGTRTKADTLAVVKVLAAAGANPNTVSADGCPPLLHAVCGGHAEVVSVLIESKVDVNATSGGTLSMIDKAVLRGEHQIVQLLLRAGALDWMGMMAQRHRVVLPQLVGGFGLNTGKLGQASVEEREIALVISCLMNDKKAVKTLLTLGVDPSCVHAGQYPLMLAAKRGYIEIARDLIAAGADIAKEVSGTTCIKVAASGKHRDVVVLLLERVKELKKKNVKS